MGKGRAESAIASRCERGEGKRVSAESVSAPRRAIHIVQDFQARHVRPPERCDEEHHGSRAPGGPRKLRRLVSRVAEKLLFLLVGGDLVRGPRTFRFHVPPSPCPLRRGTLKRPAARIWIARPLAAPPPSPTERLSSRESACRVPCPCRPGAAPSNHRVPSREHLSPV